MEKDKLKEKIKQILEEEFNWEKKAIRGRELTMLSPNLAEPVQVALEPIRIELQEIVNEALGVDTEQNLDALAECLSEIINKFEPEKIGGYKYWYEFKERKKI